MVRVEEVLFYVLNHDCFFISLIIDQCDRAKRLVIHSKHIFLPPWAQVMPSSRTRLKRFKECLDNGNCSFSEVRVFASGFQERLLVLLDKRSVEIAFLESVDGESAAKELNVRWQSDHVVVLEGHVKRLDSLRTRRFVYDALGDHWVVVGRNSVSFFDTSVDTKFAWNLHRLSEHIDSATLRQELLVWSLCIDSRLKRMTD